MRIFLTLLLFIFIHSPLHAELVLVDVTETDGIATKQQLDRRIKTLEKTVRELQLRVAHLEKAQTQAEPLSFYSCSIEVALAGRFQARAESQSRAIQQVLKQCLENTSQSSLCNKRNVNCAKE